MSTFKSLKSLAMLAALATVLGLGTACFRIFAGSDEPARDAETEACAGLSGQAREDCEARHGKP